MNNTDKEYFRLLNTVLNKGRTKHNRTGVDTIGVFGDQARFDLSEGFPILTTKKVWFKGIVHELLWFIKGDTNIKYLVDNEVHIWDAWCYAKYKKEFESPYFSPLSQKEFIEHIKKYDDYARDNGELGQGTYGQAWCNFEGVNQLQKVLDKLKTNPDDRRMIVSAWQPHLVDNCALPPCHIIFHFNTEELTLDERRQHLYNTVDKNVWESNCGNPWPYTHEEMNEERLDIPKRKLNLLLYQRSADTFLGVPFNITSYALLLAMVAYISNMVPGVFTHTYGDLHIYKNHLPQIKEQMSREPMELPILKLNKNVKSLFDFKYDDIELLNYVHHPAIKGEVAI